MSNPYRYFNSSPEVASVPCCVMMYVRYPLSLRNINYFFAQRGIDIRHETVRFLVEPVWPDVWSRKPKEAGLPSRGPILSGGGIWMRRL